MAEKTILTVDLYDNVLTEKAGDYSGKVSITGTVRNADIADASLRSVLNIALKLFLISLNWPIRKRLKLSRKVKV